MRNGLELDNLFPIKDIASARLMLVKATCLLEAKVIDQATAAMVLRQAYALLSPMDASEAA
jgi:hypothetical protein